jgi:hypothetical protein
MKKFYAAFGAWAVGLLVAPAAFAVTATSMGSFEGEEEPTQIYRPSSNSFVNDSYDNMTSPSSGTFRFVLRFRSSQWDGDRATGNTDRQRAEVKGLGAHQKTDDTFEYGHTWKTNRGGSGSFWHVFQLKATNGDNGAPLVVDSLTGGSNAAVRYCSGSTSGFTVARSYGISIGSFTTTLIRVKTATSGGSLQAAINGGSMSGKTNVGMYRPGANDYRPKWGSYRGVSTSSPYGDDTVEQKGVTSNKKAN